MNRPTSRLLDPGSWSPLDDDLHRLQFHNDLLHQPLNRRILLCRFIKVFDQLVALGQNTLYLLGGDAGERVQHGIGIDKPFA